MPGNFLAKAGYCVESTDQWWRGTNSDSIHYVFFSKILCLSFSQPPPPPPNKLWRPWVRDGFMKGAHKDGAQGHESGVGRGGGV